MKQLVITGIITFVLGLAVAGAVHGYGLLIIQNNRLTDSENRITNVEIATQNIVNFINKVNQSPTK